MARGTMKFYQAEKGRGAISSPELPTDQDAWVHFSSIEVSGYRMLTAGDVVDFDYESARQDSFQFRATRVRHLGPGPAPTLRRINGRVTIAPDGTPETPLTLQQRHGHERCCDGSDECRG